MKETLKTSIISNVGRILVGFAMLLITWAVAPVKELIQVPKQMEILQKDFKTSQQHFISALDKQQKTDSCLLQEVVRLKQTDQALSTDVGTLKSKLVAIQDEFPVLHQRFNDIEQAVANTRNHELAFELPFNINTNEYRKTTN